MRDNAFMQGVTRRHILLAFALYSFAPVFVHAQVAGFVFVSSTQTLAPGTPSQTMTVQAQASGGASITVPSTACLSLTSTSQTGQFSSSATNWVAASVLTMNKNTANKNFYYEDAQAGTPTITVQIALKPDSVTSSCASWPPGQWGSTWTVSQQITITGATSASTDTSTSDASSSDAASTQTPQQSQTATQAQTQSVSSYVPPPVPTLFADAGEDRTVIVGADTEYDGRAYDRDENVLDGATTRFLWNFGDGETAEGPTVLHHFSYPGRYAVVLSVAEDKSAGDDELIVTAEPAELSFETLPDGSVAIENDAGHDLDLSGWLVKQLLESFPLPEHSIVLSGETLRIPHTTLGFWADASAELDYPNGVLAFSAGQESEASSTSPALVSAAPAKFAPSLAARTPRITADPAPLEDDPAEAPEATDTATTSQMAAASAASPGSYGWWLTAGALGLIALGALVAAKRFGKEEWDIAET